MKVAAILADPDYPRLKQVLIERTGLAYYADKDEDLASRLGRRLMARNATGCAAYSRMLENGSGTEEMDALISELTVGETYFFRQSEHFELLRQTVLPDLLERNRTSRRLRIWSAGCATGAEAYSLALLLQRDMAQAIAGWSISILGTDINRRFLARASEARYDEWAFREGPADLRTRCFRGEGKQWVLRPEYRQWVSFSYHNLVRDAFEPASFDLIVCRNVMIYFSAETMRAIVARFYDSLVEGGWLLVGHAEPNSEIFKAFRTVSESGITLYQKAGVVEISPPALPPVPPPPVAVRPPAARRIPPAPAAKPVRASLAEARALADQGHWPAAAARCRALLKTDGLNPAAHFLFALVLEHTGAAAHAEQELRRAIYLDRGFVVAHYHLGLLLQRTAQADQARKSFENVIELLGHKRGDEPLEHGDGITAAELAELANMHLERLA